MRWTIAAEQLDDLIAQRDAAKIRAEMAERQLAQVRKMHERVVWDCVSCRVRWPCLTSRALGGYDNNGRAVDR